MIGDPGNWDYDGISALRITERGRDVARDSKDTMLDSYELALLRHLSWQRGNSWLSIVGIGRNVKKLGFSCEALVDAIIALDELGYIEVRYE